MNGTVQIKKGRPNYYIVLDYVDETTGKRKRPWISTDIPIAGNNKRKANERLKEVLAEYENQNVDLSKDVLFTVFIKEWLENLKPSIEDVTYDAYYLVIYNQIVPFYEPKKLMVKELMPLHIQQYVNFKLKTVSPNTVRKHLFNLSKCLDSAVRQNVIVFNPVKRIDMPKKIKYLGAKYYDEKQIEKLISISRKDILESIIQITLFFGLRRSEVIGLKWNAVDFDNDLLIIQHTTVQMGTKIHKKDSTKTNSSYRTLPMPKIIKGVFQTIKYNQAQDRLLQPNDYINEGYVFTRRDGSLITPNYVTKHFKWLITKHNLPIIRFHDLRHSSASYLLYLGFSMKEIQMWLGHGDIGTTMNIYAHLDISAKQNMAYSLNEKFTGFNV